MLLKLGTGNGERGTGNGERGTGNGERGTGNREQESANNCTVVIHKNSKWRTKEKKTVWEPVLSTRSSNSIVGAANSTDGTVTASVDVIEGFTSLTL